MRRILVVALLALSALGLSVATAGPASARTCYTPHVAGFDTIESCIWLPELQ